MYVSYKISRKNKYYKVFFGTSILTERIITESYANVCEAETMYGAKALSE